MILWFYYRSPNYMECNLKTIQIFRFRCRYFEITLPLHITDLFHRFCGTFSESLYSAWTLDKTARLNFHQIFPHLLLFMNCLTIKPSIYINYSQRQWEQALTFWLALPMLFVTKIHYDSRKVTITLQFCRALPSVSVRSYIVYTPRYDLATFFHIIW